MIVAYVDDLLGLDVEMKDGVVRVSSDAYTGVDGAPRFGHSSIILLIDGMPVAWTSKRQSVVATSSCEAELSQPSINVATKEEGLSTRTRHLAVPIHSNAAEEAG